MIKINDKYFCTCYNCKHHIPENWVTFYCYYPLCFNCYENLLKDTPKNQFRPVIKLNNEK